MNWFIRNKIDWIGTRIFMLVFQDWHSIETDSVDGWIVDIKTQIYGDETIMEAYKENTDMQYFLRGSIF
jgi:hypothetical protein